MRRTTEPDPVTGTARTRKDRKEADLCPRCGAPLSRSPELNVLTGRPLLRDGATVDVATCAAACGYVYRPKAR